MLEESENKTNEDIKADYTIINKYNSLMAKLGYTKSFFDGNEEFVIKQVYAANIKGLEDEVRIFLDKFLGLNPEEYVQINIGSMKDRMIASLEQVMGEAKNYQIKEIPSMH